MRAVIQRVKRASVVVESQVVGKINQGLLVLIGVCPEDSDEDCVKLAKKITSLKLWPTADGSSQWKRSVIDMGGQVLCVSQFTLYARVKKGTKPDFHEAAGGETAINLYNKAKKLIADSMPNGESDVQDGQFGAMMDVELVNDGPVTIQYDTKQ